jgi:hypothetical protein
MRDRTILKEDIERWIGSRVEVIFDIEPQERRRLLLSWEERESIVAGIQKGVLDSELVSWAPLGGLGDFSPLLWWAVTLGDTQMVTAILGRGVNPDEPTILAEASTRPRSTLFESLPFPDIVKLLLGHGASVEARDALMRTPLHLATRHGPLTVAALLEAGANPLADDCYGQKPIAAVVGCTESQEVYQLLLDAGLAALEHTPLPPLVLRAAGKCEADKNVDVNVLSPYECMIFIDAPIQDAGQALSHLLPDATWYPGRKECIVIASETKLNVLHLCKFGSMDWLVIVTPSQRGNTTKGYEQLSCDMSGKLECRALCIRSDSSWEFKAGVMTEYCSRGEATAMDYAEVGGEGPGAIEAIPEAIASEFSRWASGRAVSLPEIWTFYDGYCHRLCFAGQDEDLVRVDSFVADSRKLENV